MLRIRSSPCSSSAEVAMLIRCSGQLIPRVSIPSVSAQAEHSSSSITNIINCMGASKPSSSLHHTLTVSFPVYAKNGRRFVHTLKRTRGDLCGAQDRNVVIAVNGKYLPINYLSRCSER
ncbi:hypothetical protein CY34DRAFT_138168 [Suillus luteus UH-Slu-Lm8-n1]|uniref:Unplaced genomic scaffold CY34scaffold_1043, whole genome shotgun sequence n=1 Tax=Suillus luteus UH-Slu-Lm8-n1 TaxID=930992 RepID=A0A0C9ZTG5_9AGAM|nr:hypothetical protein CY34DRAFT_138168 [Suillus luteus UH-Slu-Lm8-n1]